MTNPIRIDLDKPSPIAAFAFTDCYDLDKPIAINQWIKDDPYWSLRYFAWEMMEEYSNDPFHIIAPIVPAIRRMARRIAWKTGLADDLFQAAIVKLREEVKQPTPTELDIVDITVYVVHQIDVAGWCSFDVESRNFCGCDEFCPPPSRKELLTIAKNEMRDCKCKILYGRYDYKTYKGCRDVLIAHGKTEREADRYLRSMQNEAVARIDHNRELARLIAKYPYRSHSKDFYPSREIVPESQYERVYACIEKYLTADERELFRRFFPWNCHTTRLLAEYLGVSKPTAREILLDLDAAVSRIVEQYPFNF